MVCYWEIPPRREFADVGWAPSPGSYPLHARLLHAANPTLAVTRGFDPTRGSIFLH
jgi:hypothetical protein